MSCLSVGGGNMVGFFCILLYLVDHKPGHQVDSIFLLVLVPPLWYFSFKQPCTWTTACSFNSLMYYYIPRNKKKIQILGDSE